MAAVSEKEKVIKNLRACLISAPSGVLANDLNRDYKSLVGEPIPYKRLGYSTLEDFLQVLPDVDVVNRGGQWHISAKVGASSSHISKLVQGQKKTSKKPRKAKFSSFRFSRPAPQRFQAPPQNQIPHFMQNAPVRRAPPPKPQAQYIAPDKLPVKSYPARGPVNNNDIIHGPVKTYPTSGSKPQPSQSSKPATRNQVAPGQYRAPDDLPVTVYPTKPSQPAPRPTPQSTQSKLAAQFAAFLETTGAPAPATRPPLLPTPVNKPALLPTPASRAPLLPTPNRPALLPTPEIQPVQPPAPKAPSEPTKPFQKPPRTSIADRLNVYKKKTNLTSISEAQMLLNHEPNHNGTNGFGISPTTYSEAVTHESNNEPENFPCEVKVVDPISWNKDKNRRQQSDLQSPQSPNKTYKNVEVQPYHYDESSYIFKLSQYAEKQNWPKPDFFVLNRRVGNPRSPENKYICRVTVNCTPIGTHPTPSSQAVSCHEFSSYPAEFGDVNSAMSYVAKKAYDALLEQDTIQLPVTDDINVIMGRIREMVKGKFQGVWLYQIEKTYKIQFNERLPKDLPHLLNQCPTLEVSKLAESYYIVRPKLMEAESPKYFSPTYVNRLTVNKLSYPNDETWDVFVSKVKSLNEIYIRIIGDQYSVVYESLAAEMDEYYVNQETEIPEFIEIGKYYGLLTQDSCFRVLVTSYDNCEAKYQAYLIDVGDVEFVEPEQLRVLLPKFYVVASQAIPCFLDNLLDYDFNLEKSEILDNVLDMVLGKSFASLLSDRDPIHLTLYDTDGNEDININCALKRLVDESFSYPDLFEEGILKEIQVTTVDGNGLVFIQIPSWTLSCLNGKIALISNGYYIHNYLSDLEKISKEKIYFWSNGPTRVKVLEVQMSEEVEVDFIDTGGQKTVHVSELYEIEQLNEMLPKIPPQAVPVLLHDVNNGTLKAQQVSYFLDMVNSYSESPTIGKVVTFHEGMPQIEIFVRNDKRNLLVSVNSNVALSEAMSSRVSQISLDQCDTASVSTFSHADGVFLKGSIIPKIGDDLDIYVTGIASPLNFTVTPVSHLKYLNQLAEEMIIFYSSTSNIEIYKPRVGDCVAAQSDGCWFRVQIDRKLDPELYSGKYLDHGHMDTFPIKSIRFLPDKFKKLPYLAFRAQLHGIKPVNNDWDVEDVLAVRAMIHNKKFYSKVRDIIHDPEGRKLSLEIVDTSTENDVYISRQLVMENRALPDLPLQG